MGIDPDLLALESATDAIQAELTALGIPTMPKSQRRKIASAAVRSWCINRCVEWSNGRQVTLTGESPDAYTIGFAQAILPALGDAQFPWDQAIGDWSKDQISLFLATAFELMEEQRATTLERPTDIVSVLKGAA